MKIYVVLPEELNERVGHVNYSLSNYSWERKTPTNYRTLDYQQVIDQGFVPLSNYLSPNTNRGISSEEISTVIAHYQLWQQIVEEDSSALIFTDDIKLTSILRKLDIDKFDNSLKDYEIIYLGCDENQIEKVTIIDKILYQPIYPKNICAYCLSPAGAKKLLAAPIRQYTIVLDDYLAIMSNQQIGEYAIGKNLANHVNFFQEYSKLSATAMQNRLVIQLYRVLKGMPNNYGNSIVN